MTRIGHDGATNKIITPEIAVRKILSGGVSDDNRDPEVNTLDKNQQELTRITRNYGMVKAKTGCLSLLQGRLPKPT